MFDFLQDLIQEFEKKNKDKDEEKKGEKRKAETPSANSAKKSDTRSKNSIFLIQWVSDVNMVFLDQKDFPEA